MPRACVIVLDGVGAGALPDAAEFGDEGSDTLGNLSRRVGGLAMQNVHSPAPNTDYSPNWPALKSNASATTGSLSLRRSVRVSGVSSSTCSTMAR